MDGCRDMDTHGHGHSRHSRHSRHIMTLYTVLLDAFSVFSSRSLLASAALKAIRIGFLCRTRDDTHQQNGVVGVLEHGERTLYSYTLYIYIYISNIYIPPIYLLYTLYYTLYLS